MIIRFKNGKSAIVLLDTKTGAPVLVYFGDWFYFGIPNDEDGVWRI